MLSRVAFNMCVRNTDDHLRNHAAFWDGEHLKLTPAYDLAPQPGSGSQARQSLDYGGGHREADLAALIREAGRYGLSRGAALAKVEQIVMTIRATWAETADANRLTSAEANAMLGVQILNESIAWNMPSGFLAPRKGRPRAKGDLKLTPSRHQRSSAIHTPNYEEPSKSGKEQKL